jgi:NAD(P)-dependent dehydrogenase (short-subunit alcohol dehydrogenase family)
MTTLDWCRQNLPDLRGKRALVTGAAGGLGYETALGLAALGAQVILADRNVEGGNAALEHIRSQVFGARVEFHMLDLGNLAGIRLFAETQRSDGEPLDILVNNAGILPPLERRTTADGFELKFGINVLGHFALDGLLLESLRRSSAPRVVWVSSLVHRHGRIDFDDLQSRRDYEPQRAYNQAKLACLVLAMELHARAQKAGLALSALAAHPGVARTGLGNARATEKHRRVRDYMEAAAFWVAMKWLSQPQGRGALPILFAAAAPVRSGAFYGPDGFGEMKGDPVEVKPSKPALDAELRQRLWAECERLTGVRYDALG